MLPTSKAIAISRSRRGRLRASYPETVSSRNPRLWRDRDRKSRLINMKTQSIENEPLARFYMKTDSFWLAALR